MFVSIKPLHVSVFFLDRLQGVLRCALCRYCSSHRFAFVEFILLRSMWPHEDGREKRPKRVGVLYLLTRF